MAITPVTNRNRVVEELGKGIEALRSAGLTLQHGTTVLTVVGVLGPFDVDVDIVEAYLTVGSAITDNSSNVITIFNGTVAANLPIVTYNYHTVTPTLQVPIQMPLTAANIRVKAGTPICVQMVFGGTDTNAVASIVLHYEIPVTDPNAQITTYHAYDFVGAH